MSDYYIPEKVRVGYAKREDTFNGLLAYLISFDVKGKCKERSGWEHWRDVSVPFDDYDNTPADGFVLNKNKRRYGYRGHRSDNIRLYDSRGFEFEISPENLMIILNYSDVSKGEIKEKCVYSWEGSKLFLLPVNSEQYRESIKYTDKLKGTFSLLDLKVGATYSLKKCKKSTYIYMGRLPYRKIGGPYVDIYTSDIPNLFGKVKKEHVFYDSEYDNFRLIQAKNIASEVMVELGDEYFQDLVDKLETKISTMTIKEFLLDSSVDESKGFYTLWYRSPLVKILDDTVSIVNVIGGYCSAYRSQECIVHKHTGKITTLDSNKICDTSSYNKNWVNDKVRTQYDTLTSKGYGHLKILNNKDEIINLFKQ